VTRILQNLNDQGWHIESLDLIKEVTDKHGGPDNALKALHAMGSLKEMQEKQKKAEQIAKNKIDEAIAKDQEITRLKTENLAITTYVEMSKILIEQYSYDLNSIKTLMNFAKKYGPPWEALEAINKYNQIQEMDDTIKNQKIEATKNRDEIANTKAKLDEIQQTTNDAYTALGEVEGKLDEVAVTQGLHDILIDPKKAQLTKNEFLNTAYAVTDGLIKYTESKSVELSDWQDCKQSLEYVRSRTTKLIGKE
jgi:hypothetical protein